MINFDSFWFMSHIVSRGFDSIRFVTFLRVLLFSKFNASQHLNDFIQVIVNFYWAWNFLLCQGNADFLYIYTDVRSYNVFSPNSVPTLKNSSYGSCKGRCLIRVLQLGRSIFPVNFRKKCLLWNVDVHFHCAGLQKICVRVLGWFWSAALFL